MINFFDDATEGEVVPAEGDEGDEEDDEVEPTPEGVDGSGA